MEISSGLVTVTLLTEPLLSKKETSLPDITSWPSPFCVLQSRREVFHEPWNAEGIKSFALAENDGAEIVTARIQIMDFNFNIEKSIILVPCMV